MSSSSNALSEIHTWANGQLATSQVGCSQNNTHTLTHTTLSAKNVTVYNTLCGQSRLFRTSHSLNLCAGGQSLLTIYYYQTQPMLGKPNVLQLIKVAKSWFRRQYRQLRWQVSEANEIHIVTFGT